MAQGLTQTEFELDKNATNDLLTEHLGTLKSKVNAGTGNTSLTVCERQFDHDGIAATPPIDVTIPSTPFKILIDGETMNVTALGTPSTQTGGCGFSDPADSTNQVRVWTVTRAVSGGSPLHVGGSDVTLLDDDSVVPGDDWDDVHASVLADETATPPITENHECTDLGAVACSWEHDGFALSVFTTGGSKDDLNINPEAGEAGTGWKHTNSSVPDADEILDAFAVKYSNGRQLLFFGADRYATNGAKDFGFWFFRDEVVALPDGTFSGNHTRRTAGLDGIPGNADDVRGDLLALGTFTQGGAITTLRLFEWVGTGGNTNGTLQSVTSLGDCAAGGGSAQGCTTVNNTTVPSPWDYTGKGGSASDVIYSGGLIEGGLDLTALGFEGCFASFMAETRSSPEPGAQLKDFVLGSFESCQADVTTTPGDSTGAALTDNDEDDLPDIQIGTGAAGVDATDTAEVDVEGLNTWSGTVDFYICGPIASGECTGDDGVFISTENVSQADAEVTSDTANLTEVGRYCWRGEFTPSAASAALGLEGDIDESAGECFEVLPVTPTLDTIAWSNGDSTGSAQTDPVDFGDQVFDKAVLSGTAYQPGDDGGTIPDDPDSVYPSINATMDTPANGTITFSLYAAADCTTLATSDDADEDNPEAVTVEGDGDYFTSGFTPDAPGDYDWVAVYDGDSPNTLGTSHNALTGDDPETGCTDEDEDVTVRQIPTEIKTKQSWYPNDTATITSSVSGDLLVAGGTVDFYLYDSATCTGTVLYSEQQILDGGANSEEVSTSNYAGSTAKEPDGTTTVTPHLITTAYDDAAASEAGPYSWKVVFTPDTDDSVHTGSQSACTTTATESFSITYTNDNHPDPAP